MQYNLFNQYCFGFIAIYPITPVLSYNPKGSNVLNYLCLVLWEKIQVFFLSFFIYKFFDITVIGSKYLTGSIIKLFYNIYLLIYYKPLACMVVSSAKSTLQLFQYLLKYVVVVLIKTS